MRTLIRLIIISLLLSACARPDNPDVATACQVSAFPVQYQFTGHGELKADLYTCTTKSGGTCEVAVSVDNPGIRSTTCEGDLPALGGAQ